MSSGQDSHDPLQRQCFPLLVARSIRCLMYPASGILTKLSQGSASRLIMALLSYLHFVSPSAAHLHISLALYRPLPSITVSSDHRLVYVYAYAYANVNILALV
ncbi:hypothetical protein B0H13DRAFT_2318118 [Mycena leptocephala]|nr:hypothetical protein B0H13DRAFT_2318118 [Mycena leptocephala]